MSLENIGQENGWILFLVITTMLSVALLLKAEYDNNQSRKWLFKPLAATGFVALGFLCTNVHSFYGTWIIIGLILSWLGDVLLIPKNKFAFFLGIFAFLFAHVVYSYAFFYRKPNVLASLLCFVALLSLGYHIVSGLWSQIDKNLKIPVMAYLVAICLMVSLGIGTSVSSRNVLIGVGTVGFLLSDISVARNRFANAGFGNKLWGSPLYFGSQICLALSIKFHPTTQEIASAFSQLIP
ncbi:MAG: lysoplasmalogenase [Myxococcota bacterium]|nr:lysoplasmalogenase [Myxococcota bacterium]